MARASTYVCGKGAWICWLMTIRNLNHENLSQLSRERWSIAVLLYIPFFKTGDIEEYRNCLILLRQMRQGGPEERWSRTAIQACRQIWLNYLSKGDTRWPHISHPVAIWFEWRISPSSR